VGKLRDHVGGVMNRVCGGKDFFEKGLGLVNNTESGSRP